MATRQQKLAEAARTLVHTDWDDEDPAGFYALTEAATLYIEAVKNAVDDAPLDGYHDFRVRAGHSGGHVIPRLSATSANGLIIQDGLLEIGFTTETLTQIAAVLNAHIQGR